MKRSCRSNNRYRKATPGIYAIVNKINNKMYIGSAVNLQKRKHEHFLAMRKNAHANRFLQFSVNKYGIENFEFKILEVTHNNEVLIDREQFWMDELKSVVPNGFNLKPLAASNLGLRHTAEAKEKNRIAHKGKPLSEETKLKMSLVRKGRKQTQDWIDKRVKSFKINKRLNDFPIEITEVIVLE